jgi:hypothetical protein
MGLPYICMLFTIVDGDTSTSITHIVISKTVTEIGSKFLYFTTSKSARLGISGS